MSSATSIEKVRLEPDAAEAQRDADRGFHPWHFFVLASLAAATAAVVMSRRSTPEHLIAISLTIDQLRLHDEQLLPVHRRMLDGRSRAADDERDLHWFTPLTCRGSTSYRSSSSGVLG